jgi:hypothetical protein
MAEPITDANSSFFGNSSIFPIKKETQPQPPIKIATQEFTRGAVQDNKTIKDNISEISYSKATSQTPIKIATQEFTKGAVQDNKTTSDGVPQISFSNAISQAKAAAAAINPGAIGSMNQADAIKYAQTSISDLEQKMAQVAMLNSMASAPRASSEKQQAPVSANNTQVSNNVSNVTNIMSDYLRNMRLEYEKTPQWRSETG